MSTSQVRDLLLLSQLLLVFLELYPQSPPEKHSVCELDAPPCAENTPV